MQGKIISSMDLPFCQSETGFSLDELVTNRLKCCDHGHFRLNGSFERRIRTGSEFKCRSGK